MYAHAAHTPVCTRGLCTKPRMGLLWSSPGVQLRVTARCLASVTWRSTGGSGRSRESSKTQQKLIQAPYPVFDRLLRSGRAGCLPHKVRVLLASTMSSFVITWQVYTPSSPGSTLEMIRSGPSNMYLRKNVAGFRFGNPHLQPEQFPLLVAAVSWQYLTFHHCVTQRSSGHFSSIEGRESAAWGR